MPMQLSLSSHYHGAEEESVVPPGTSLRVLNGAEFNALYELGDNVLGRGHGSEVKVARCRQTQELFACKIIAKCSIPRVERLHDEVRVLEAARGHNGLATLQALCETKQELLLLTDFAAGGDLYERMIRNRFSESETREVVARLLAATAHLHARNIIHRDIKPENVLLASQANNTEVKLTDFGTAKMCDDHGMVLSNSSSSSSVPAAAGSDGVVAVARESIAEMQTEEGEDEGGNAVGSQRSQLNPTRPRAYTSVGTDNYIAPEILRGEGYGIAVDVWSIGVVTYLLLAGALPFTSMRAMLSDNTVKLPRVLFEGVSDAAKDLVLALLTVDPDARITCEQALQHPWFATTVAAIHQQQQAVTPSDPALRLAPIHPNTAL